MDVLSNAGSANGPLPSGPGGGPGGVGGGDGAAIHDMQALHSAAAAAAAAAAVAATSTANNPDSLMTTSDALTASLGGPAADMVGAYIFLEILIGVNWTLGNSRLPVLERLSRRSPCRR